MALSVVKQPAGFFQSLVCIYCIYLQKKSGFLTQLWSSMQKSQMWNYDYGRNTKYFSTWNHDSLIRWWCLHPVFKMIQEMVSGHDHSLNSSLYSVKSLKSKSILVQRKVSRVSAKAERQKLYESSLTGTMKDKKSLHSTLFAYSLICVPDCEAAT